MSKNKKKYSLMTSMILISSCFIMVDHEKVLAEERGHEESEKIVIESMFNERNQKFITELEIPAVAIPTQNFKTGCDHYRLEMKSFKKKLHPMFSEKTELYGYNGQFPGPTIVAQRGKCVEVEYVNLLPQKHFLPVDEGFLDRMLIDAKIYKKDKRYNTLKGKNGIPTIPHLHGGLLEASSDGFPESAFGHGESKIMTYPNNQRADLLWYHDHALNYTHLNPYAGLAGGYIIRDISEKSMGLPGGKYEIPLVITSKTFREDGDLFYPKNIPLEMYGETLMVNSSIYPRLKVEPRMYRFRIVNGSNARYLALKVMDGKRREKFLADGTIASTVSDGPLPTLFQIGADGGFFERPIVYNASGSSQLLYIAPGMRADVLVDFSKFKGKDFYLTNIGDLDAEDLGRNKLGPDYIDSEEGESRLSDIMMVSVGKEVKNSYRSLTEKDLKLRLPRINKLVQKSDTIVRDIVIKKPNLSMSEMYHGTPVMMDMPTFDGLTWGAPIVETPKVNSVEVWRIFNLTTDPHPVHIHQGTFQVLRRQKFNFDDVLAKGPTATKKDLKILPNSKVDLDPGEIGERDVVVIYPGEALELIKNFGPYPGKFVYHCHILEHEEMMMRPFEIRN